MEFNIRVHSDYIVFSGLTHVKVAESELLQMIELCSPHVLCINIRVLASERWKIALNVLVRLCNLESLWILVLTNEIAFWHRFSLWITAQTRLKTLEIAYMTPNLPTVEMFCESCAVSHLEELRVGANFLFGWERYLLPMLTKISCSKTLKYVLLKCGDYLASKSVDGVRNALFRNYSIEAMTFGNGLAWQDVNINDIVQRNKLLRWSQVHETIVCTAIALFPHQLPLYIALAIVDAIPYYDEAHAQYKKVRVLERCFATAQRVSERRRQEHRRGGDKNTERDERTKEQ